MTAPTPKNRPYTRSAGALRWTWIFLAAMIGIAVFLLTSISQGACSDSPDPAVSRCEFGPAIGVAGVWIAWIAYGAFVVFCLVKTIRARRA